MNKVKIDRRNINLNQFHYFVKANARFILNINSGQCFAVDTIAYDLIKRIDKYKDLAIVKKKLIKEYPEEQIDEVINELLLVNKERSKTDEDKSLYNNIKKELDLDGLVLMICQDCNLSCEYCYGENGTYDSKPIFMNNKISESAINFLINNSKSYKKVSISFFGGEPLLNFDAIKHAVSYSKNRGLECSKEFNFSITTNGTLLNNRIATYLIENNFNIILSLDGPKDVHDKLRFFPNKNGTYDIIMKNINRIPKNIRKKIGIRATLTKKYMGIKDIITHFEELGFSDVTIAPVSTNDTNLQMTHNDLKSLRNEYSKLALYYDLKFKNKIGFADSRTKTLLESIHNLMKTYYQCSAGRKFLAVSTRGDLFLCHRFVGNGKYKVGNIITSKIRGKVIEKVIRKTVDRRIMCNKCWARYYCGGGCYYESELHFGKFDMSNNPNYCENFREYLEWMFWLYHKHRKTNLIENKSNK